MIFHSYVNFLEGKSSNMPKFHPMVFLGFSQQNHQPTNKIILKWLLISENSPPGSIPGRAGLFFHGWRVGTAADCWEARCVSVHGTARSRSKPKLDWKLWTHPWMWMENQCVWHAWTGPISIFFWASSSPSLGMLCFFAGVYEFIGICGWLWIQCLKEEISASDQGRHDMVIWLNSL